MVMETVQQYFPSPVNEENFVTSTAATLSSLGFNRENTLPIAAVCRDEICSPFVGVIEKHWGNCFTLGGLGGLPFGGRTGLGAASHHAPDIHDRERFVVYAMTHIGFGPDGEIGGCVRPGMKDLNSACGALKAYSGQLTQGNVETRIFTDDGEFGMLAHRLAKAGSMMAGTDLISVTNAALSVINEDIDKLATAVFDTGKADYAVFTGTQIHLPDQNLVQPSAGWLVINGQRQDIQQNPDPSNS